MGWSTKVAIGGDIHGSQVNRHPPHHPPSSYSLVGARLEHFTLIVRMYGFEGEAGREGEGFRTHPGIKSSLGGSQRTKVTCAVLSSRNARNILGDVYHSH